MKMSKKLAREIVEKFESYKNKENASEGLFWLGLKVFDYLSTEMVGELILAEARRVLAKKGGKE